MTRNLSATLRSKRRRLQRLPEPAEAPHTPEEIKGLIAAWAARLGVAVGRVQIRTICTKWASCFSQGPLPLNHDVLGLPRGLVDYVLCHELLYLKFPGHGKGWQAMMGVYVPDWRAHERRLAGEGMKEGEDGS